MPVLIESVDRLAAAAAGLPRDSMPFEQLSDDELTAVQARLAETSRSLAACQAAGAAEIARRSSRERGYSGLAQRGGFRTPQAFIQNVTGVSQREAIQLVTAGVVMTEGERAAAAGPDVPADLRTPWLVPVGQALGRGELSVEAALAIRAGLGTPAEGITVEQLRVAAEQLVGAARVLNVDELAHRARDLRDDLDEAGIADREQRLIAERRVKVFRRHNGMIRLLADLDPESAAPIVQWHDGATAPRRGGVRFADPGEQERADRLVSDPRTTEQIAADSLVELIRAGLEVNPGVILGKRRPGVRVLVTERALRERNGHGRIEGDPAPVSIETVERLACDAGIVPIVFDADGQVVNLGRELRLFSSAQRIGLAARDGGCLWPRCERPPAFTEAHHINEWARDRGKTDIADGVLLCRFHHMLLHNNHWRITREGGSYSLIPPVTEDPAQRAIPMPTKSAALKDLARSGAVRLKQREREWRAAVPARESRAAVPAREWRAAVPARASSPCTTRDSSLHAPPGVGAARPPAKPDAPRSSSAVVPLVEPDVLRPRAGVPPAKPDALRSSSAVVPLVEPEVLRPRAGVPPAKPDALPPWQAAPPARPAALPLWPPASPVVAVADRLPMLPPGCPLIETVFE